MSIGNAISFLNKVQSDADFRKSCYSFSSQSELMNHLRGEGYGFDELEFENAINHLLLKCNEEEEANEIYHLQSWFSLFG